MSNLTCSKPELCGVKTHRPGTVAACMTAGAKNSGSARTSLSATPKLAVAKKAAPTVDYSELQSDELAEQVVDDFGIYVASAHNEGLQFSDDGRKWEHTKWELELKGQDGQSFKYEFGMGKLHGDKTPQPEQVLDYMIDEARFLEHNSSLEEYAGNSGHDLETPEGRRETKRIFKGSQESSQKLKKFFGDEVYQSILGADGTFV